MPSTSEIYGNDHCTTHLPLPLVLCGILRECVEDELHLLIIQCCRYTIGELKSIVDICRWGHD